jgi:ribosome-binding factor A
MVAFKSGQDFPPAGSEERIIMGKNHRPDRMAGEIRKIIGELLVNGVKDPRVTENFVNVTDVEVTNDGSFAYVYLTALSFTNDEEAKAQQQEDVLSGMNSAKGLFKKEIAKALKVRRIPELVFRMDKAAEYGRHIDEILSTLPFDEYHAVDPNEAEEEDEL